VLVLPLCSQTDTEAKPAQDEGTLQAARIGVDGAALLEFFRKATPRNLTPEKLKALVAQLGAEDFAAREKASAALIALGTAVVPRLRQAQEDPDAEVAGRATHCLKKIAAGPGPEVYAAAARLLAVRKPAGAAEALLDFLPFAVEEVVIEGIRQSLPGVTLRDGKPEAIVLKALKDAHPLKRSFAAEALCRVGPVQTRPAVRALLKDPDAHVRWRVAVALVGVKDNEAIPTLIDLLEHLPPEEARRVEAFLFRLTGTAGPLVTLADEIPPAKVRKAWADWWREHGAKLGIEGLAGTQRLQGFTLIVEPETGRARELDDKNKERWRISGLMYPLSAQVIEEGRVLIAEYRGGRVTERNFKGEILHKFTVSWPIAAQRLSEGRTFIATRNQLLELDKDNKEVFNLKMPGVILTAAVKLRNDDIACITSAGVFLRLSPQGKELKSFPVGSRLNFGLGIDVLPSGRVLVPEFGNDRVVEYDAAGKVIWEATVARPDSAVRLPSGNTLIASGREGRLVELDRNGKVVWEHRLNGSPMRARRR
jgi:hypothetical protein